MSLRQRVQDELARMDVPQPPATPWILGVSGGPDSLALLHILYRLYPDGELIVAHLNHRLRPPAVSEAKFVRDTAVSLNLPFHQQSVDVAALARREGFSIEEAARLARYDFLAALARQNEMAVIAVGHNADDQAETVLMHLLRGSGLAGLRGMQPLSPAPGAPDLWLARPLLAISRAEIQAYCAEHQLRPVDDASNRDLTYLRNRVRHRLLPELETYNPQIRERLRHLAAVTTADYALLEGLVDEAWADVRMDQGRGWVRLERAAWKAQPLSLRRALLRRAARQLVPSPVEIGFRPIEGARRLAEREESGGEATLPGGVRLRVGYQTLELTVDDTAVPLEKPQLPAARSYTLSVPGVLPLAGGWRLRATLAPEATPEQVKGNRDPWRAYVDVGERERVQVRPRRSGERFQPLGMGGHHARLQDVMVNRQIDAPLRERWPLVALPDHLVWVVGHHMDRRARVTAVSDRVVLLECRRNLTGDEETAAGS